MKEIFEKLIKNLYLKIMYANFEKTKISDFNFEFKNEAVCYTVEYVSPCVSLKKGGNKLCEWLLDENASNKYIEDIISDFSNVIINKKPEIQKREAKVNDQKEISIDKMADKLLHFFPDLRAKYDPIEKISEKISFFSSNILPEINKMITKKKEENKIERMFKNLCNDYVFGDLQTRCMITMLFFRGIEGKESRKKIRHLLPNYIKKTWDATLRVKRY